MHCPSAKPDWNQSIASQRRIAMQAAIRPSGFTPLGTITGTRTSGFTPCSLRPLSPLSPPVQRDDLYTSSVLQNAAHRNSARRLGQLVPPATAASEQNRGLGQRTCSQLAFQRPGSGFMRTFGKVDRTNGKPRNDTTQFRESVYGLWNISGAHRP